ncbi:response regulator transcription factor [Chloroflexus sp.]|uniref:response regulator transcription factor n=1 Tax=Chloroflexus sp. TaxID=1904827 RepID=UPI00298F2B08|nr:response regulator transcription factor [Chloroflexus sp.]MCX7860039.1 response regulator transcription factor [Chloroflexus sp.]MDW8404582.1 response regulator transcription factor [Chloroflexus sp.]
MRILLVEDDKRLARLIERVLREERYTVDVAHDGESGLDLLLQGAYDVAVIDWMLPGRDGPSLCRAARAARLPTAILLLTARGQIEDKVLGFESGADDYLVKPFAFEELLARVRALSRRFNPQFGNDELRHGEIVLDLRSYTARRGTRRLDLTPTEWRLLEYLLRNAGQTLTRQQILDYVWSFEHDVQPQMVDVYISYLRRKLNAPGEADPIVTVRGIGYRLEAERA